MYEKTQRKILKSHEQAAQHFGQPLRPLFVAATTTTLSTIFKTTCNKQANQEQRSHHHQNQQQHQHQHQQHNPYQNHNFHHRHNQHHEQQQPVIQQHHQRAKTRHYFSRGALVFLIFLSVIKESLTTTYSTSSSSTLDVTTATASPANLLPYFDFDVPRNITVTVGQTGFLHCRVERLGDKDVSWIRKRDLHILTAGSTTYTSDQRFQVLRPENSGNWTLQIKYPQPRDSGIYECQINTEPKMSLSYTFNVVELKATIIGPTDLYVKSGSDINLTCKIMQGPHELGNIFWYKGSEIIDMTTNQNEIDSGTRITVENDWSDGLTSRLKIRRASSSDTGNYTCVPTIAKSSSVYVHVIIGEHPAAMQHNSSSMHCSNFYINLCCMLFTILACCLQCWMCTNNSIPNTSNNTTTNNTPKNTLRILATKGTAATSKTPSSLRMANNGVTIAESAISATLAAATILTATSSTLSASASASNSTTTIKNMNRLPAVVRITQTKQCILSLPSSASSLSSSASSLLLLPASSACFCVPAAAKTAALIKTPHTTCNARISR